MTKHLNYLNTFSGAMKVFQVVSGLMALAFLVYSHFDTETNHVLMDSHALFLALISFCFFVTCTIILFAVLMGSTDVPYSIFYRVHGVLGSVAYIVASLTYITEANTRVADTPGLLAASLCVVNSLTFFADTIIAYEPPILSPMIRKLRAQQERQRMRRGFMM
ncbi:unnamed protein product [Ixodes hexagonus]